MADPHNRDPEIHEDLTSLEDYEDMDYPGDWDGDAESEEETDDAE